MWRVTVVFVALVILFLSVTRVGIELIAQEDGIDLLKKNEINFLITFDDGETAPSSYKFPESGMLPDNIMYGFKRIRDYFWLNFSNGDNKVKVAILIADKKIVEFTRLADKDKNDSAIEAGNEALDKLEYANSLVKTKQLHQQIFGAGFAYKEVLKQAENKFSLDTENYSKLISRIDDWNKKQEKDRYSWDR